MGIKRRSIPPTDCYGLDLYAAKLQEAITQAASSYTKIEELRVGRLGQGTITYSALLVQESDGDDSDQALVLCVPAGAIPELIDDSDEDEDPLVYAFRSKWGLSETQFDWNSTLSTLLHIEAIVALRQAAQSLGEVLLAEAELGSFDEEGSPMTPDEGWEIRELGKIRARLPEATHEAVAQLCYASSQRRQWFLQEISDTEEPDEGETKPALDLIEQGQGREAEQCQLLYEQGDDEALIDYGNIVIKAGRYPHYLGPKPYEDVLEILGRSLIRSARYQEASSLYAIFRRRLFPKKSEKLERIAAQLQEEFASVPLAEPLWRELTRIPTIRASDRAFWSSVNEHGSDWQAALREGADLSDSPSDQDLANLLDGASLDVEEDDGRLEIHSLVPLQSFHNLEDLSLQCRKLKDWNLFGELPLSKLQILGLRQSNLSSLGPLRLQRLQRLRSLWIGGNNLSTLTGLEGLHALERLQCDGNQALTSLEPLRGLASLCFLSISHTDISDLEPLAGSPLETLSCNHTLVVDLSSLAQCPSLRWVSATNCSKVKGLMALKDLPMLEAVSLRGSMKPRDAKKFKQARPDVDVSFE